MKPCQRTTLVFVTILLLTPFGCSTLRGKGGTKPNVIIMLADDTGYGDFQSFGHPTQEWTGVDRMAKEGRKFTQWNSGGITCSPSRAALLTGRFPIRSGIYGSTLVFRPDSSGGLPKSEVTIAEALKDAGYATGMVGKWHLGINEAWHGDGSHLPIHHGFDYVGTNLPMSVNWRCDPTKNTENEMAKSCFLYRSETIIEQPINMKSLTSKLVEDTKTFVNEHRKNPFFFLLSFPQTHAALFCDPRFCGKSKRGLYGDNVNEMGWAVNEVLDQLVDLGIDKDTLVIFLSDHGPIKDGCGEGGSAGIFRGGKGTTWEGGVRVPAVAWWPGTIEADTVSDAVVSSMDVFPTLLDLTGQTNYAVENDIEIDGKVITDVLKGTTKKSPHDILYHYCGKRLMAVRYGKHKVHFFTKCTLDVSGVVDSISSMCSYRNMTYIRELFGCEEGDVTKWATPLIFDLEADPEEQYRLDPNTNHSKRLLEKVSKLVKEHKNTVTIAESQVERPNYSLLSPCCDPPRCFCNYNEMAPKKHSIRPGNHVLSSRRHSRNIRIRAPDIRLSVHDGPWLASHALHRPKTYTRPLLDLESTYVLHTVSLEPARRVGTL